MIIDPEKIITPENLKRVSQYDKLNKDYGKCAYIGNQKDNEIRGELRDKLNSTSEVN